MSRRNQDKGRIEGPFVPMLVDTMASPAWKAMSPYARVVYYTLKSHYGHKIRNNGRIYLSARDGAEETGFDMKTVARSLRELRHYGFIVITERHCLKADTEKQNPVPLHGTGCTTERHITAFQGAEQLPDKVFQGAAHINEPACTTERHVSRLTTRGAVSVASLSGLRLPWPVCLLAIIGRG